MQPCVARLQQVNYQWMRSVMSDITSKLPSDQRARITAVGELIGYGRLGQLAEQLEQYVNGQPVKFVDESLPAEIVALQKRVTVAQCPIVLALCEEFGYPAVISTARELFDEVMQAPRH